MIPHLPMPSHSPCRARLSPTNLSLLQHCLSLGLLEGDRGSFEGATCKLELGDNW